MAFRVTDADVVRACTIGNRAVASRGSSRLTEKKEQGTSVSQGNLSYADSYVIRTLFRLFVRLRLKSSSSLIRNSAWLFYSTFL